MVSLGSDESFYEPLVGESNYIEAKVPEYREERKVEEEKKQEQPLDRPE